MQDNPGRNQTGKQGMVRFPAPGFLVLGFLTLMLVACSPKVEVNGNRPHSDLLNKIEPGLQRQSDVAELLGSPSSVSTFQGDVWYYISERREKVAFFQPTLLDRSIVAIRFDDKRVVQGVVVYTEDSANNIQIVSRKTPTAGKELNIFQQFLSNLGRFNK
jgi:outer membrane protein assembly factor BamE (lipoprotein component of BamABCDE complex)